MEIEPSDIRIGDTEREDAIRKLGEHMSDGRLGIDEYGERTAKVATARTRRELLALFTDLPEPRPSFGSRVTTARMPAEPEQRADPAGPAQRGDDRSAAQRLWAASVPLSALVALVLYLTVIPVWFVFLAPAAFAIVGGAIWGEDWRSDSHRWDRRRWDRYRSDGHHWDRHRWDRHRGRW